MSETYCGKSCNDVLITETEQLKAEIAQTAPFFGKWLSILFWLNISVVILFMGEYYEYTGHAEVLQRVDAVQSEKWRSLWKWQVGMVAAMIGLFVVFIMKYVYLYRTAKIFQEYS